MQRKLQDANKILVINSEGEAALGEKKIKRNSV